MSWFKTAAAAIILTGLAACGFTPLYGPQSGAAQLPAIEIANIPDREGQYLRNFLIDRLYKNGRPVDAPYILSVAPLNKKTTNMGIRKDATSTRGIMEMTTTVTLTDKSTEKIVLTRNVRSVGGYNQLDNQFASLISEQRLTDHAVEDIGNEIMTELGLYFSKNTP